MDIIVRAGSRLIAFQCDASLKNLHCFLAVCVLLCASAVAPSLMPGLFLYFCFQCIGVVVRMAHGFVISRFAIISFVLYDYYPLGVSFLFYFANSTYNYRAALPIKRAKGGRKKLATTTTEMFMHRLLNTYLNRTMNAEEKTSAKKHQPANSAFFVFSYTATRIMFRRRWNSLLFFFVVVTFEL